LLLYRAPVVRKNLVANIGEARPVSNRFLCLSLTFVAANPYSTDAFVELDCGPRSLCVRFGLPANPGNWGRWIAFFLGALVPP